MSSQVNQPQRSFLGRLLLAFFKLLLLTVAVFAGIGLGMMGYSEWNRIRSVVEDVQRPQIDLLRSDVNNLMEQGLAARLADQERQATDTLTRLETDMATLQGDLGRQTETLAAMNTQLLEMLEQFESASSDLDSLNAGIQTLQNTTDLNAEEISTLQTALDGVTEQTAALADGVTQLQAQAVDNTTELSLFRLWSLTTQMRIQLAQNDLRATQADIATARASIEALLADAPFELVDGLTQVDESLDRAASTILSDTQTASNNLDAVWIALDQMMMSLFENDDVAQAQGDTNDQSDNNRTEGSDKAEDDDTSAKDDDA